MTGQIAHLLRYPVKGLAGQQLSQIQLEENQRLAGDRLYAACRTPDATEEEAGWRPKTAFWQTYNSPALAALDCRFSADGSQLYLPAPGTGKKPAGDRQLDMASPAGRQELADFLSNFLADFLAPKNTGENIGEQPAIQIMRCTEGGFTDVKQAFVSIASLASVDQLCRAAGVAADYRRFRMNIWLEGVPAFAELGWIGRRLRLGQAELDIAEPVGRCAATHANPQTGQSDCDLVRLSRQLFGHSQLGIYARVSKPGRVQPGDYAELI